MQADSTKEQQHPESEEYFSFQKAIFLSSFSFPVEYPTPPAFYGQLSKLIVQNNIYNNIFLDD